MRRSLPLLFVGLLFFAAGCENASSPNELTLQTRDALDILPANVAVASMVNVERARASDALDAFADGHFSMQHMTGEGAARFNDLIDATGFDPNEDLERVYFAAHDGNDTTPYFVVYADYDRARLDAYIDDQPDLDLERTTYLDTPVYVTQQGEREMAFALVNDEMVVASSRAGVREMLDRIGDGSKGLSGNAEMMSLVRRAGYADDMWLAIGDLPETQAPGGDPFDQAGQMMQSAIFSAGFVDDGIAIQVQGEPRAGVDEGDVADLVRGAIATMKMSAKSDQVMLDALDGVRVREARGGVEIEGFMSEALLRSMRARSDA